MAYVLMHIQGKPQNMQENPQYKNVTEEVKTYFVERINKLNELGFNKIIIVPGFGFGKTLEHNFTLPKKRQNSIDAAPQSVQDMWDMKQQEVIAKSREVYEWAIEQGIAKEQARAVLPEGSSPPITWS